MLVVTRRQGERINVGDDVEVLIAKVNADKTVRVGISAPESMRIGRPDDRLPTAEDVRADHEQGPWRGRDGAGYIEISLRADRYAEMVLDVEPDDLLAFATMWLDRDKANNSTATAIALRALLARHDDKEVTAANV